MAATRDWGGELEAQQNLLTKQQHQISLLQKQLGVPNEADVDLPAAEYNRVFAATIALLVGNVVSWLVSSFTAGGLEGNLNQVDCLVCALCWSPCGNQISGAPRG